MGMNLDEIIYNWDTSQYGWCWGYESYPRELLNKRGNYVRWESARVWLVTTGLDVVCMLLQKINLPCLKT